MENPSKKELLLAVAENVFTYLFIWFLYVLTITAPIWVQLLKK